MSKKLNESPTDAAAGFAEESEREIEKGIRVVSDTHTNNLPKRLLRR